MTYLSTTVDKSGTAPCIYIKSVVMGFEKQNLQGSRTPMSNACLLVRCHMLSRRALHSWFGVMECISLGLQENEMLLRNNGIFLLVIIISPFYLHQGPTKLGSTLPGTPSNSKYTESWSFQAKQEREMGTGEDITYLPRDRSWPSHNLGKVKLLHLPHILWYFQAKLLAAKAPLYPRHCLAHTLWRKCWNTVWCLPQEEATKSLTLLIGYGKDLSPSQRAEMGLETAWSGGAASKTMSTGTDKSLSLCNSFKQLGL